MCLILTGMLLGFLKRSKDGQKKIYKWYWKVVFAGGFSWACLFSGPEQEYKLGIFLCRK